MATTKVRGELVDLNSATSDKGLKMPSGTEVNRPTDATGQIRNNTNESSNGGTSAMEYYNGTDWKKISNNPPPPPGFNAVTYTGTGASQSINVGFQPDIIWTKAYSVSDNHRQYNSVRGTSKILYPNLSSFEDTNSTFLTSFDSNGFTLGSGNGSNQLGRDYVAFCWSAGGGSNNPQASDTTGVAIRTYSGNEVQNRALSHGLTSAPVMQTVKNYSGTVSEFWCHLVNPPMTGTGYVYRNSKNAFTLSGASTIFGTLPDATNFYVSNNTSAHELTNGSGNSYINFLFSNIDGFSKIDTYTGANATVSVNVGFQPNMVIIKNASTSATDWLIFDTARDTGPTLTKVLNWNNGNAEVTFGNGLTLTSTGFDVPSATLVSNSFNNAGDTFSYMAFKIN